MRGKRNRTHRRSFGTLTLMVVLVALVTLLGAGTALAANHWTDITDQQWIDVYHVSAADAFTVAEGYPDGTFRPDQAVTRGQLAKMGVGGVIPLYDPAIPTFSDVSPDSIFYQYIEGAVAAGVISGYPDGTYRPQNNIARQQTNSILGSWLSQQEIAALGGIQGAHGFYSSLATWFAAEGEGVLSQFTDRLMVEPVHRPATAYLVMRGVVLGSSSGASTYLKPLSELTRAQAVTIMLRAMAVVFQADLP
jgi:S-layer homology domain